MHLLIFFSNFLFLILDFGLSILNFRPIQEHCHNRSILIHLDMIYRPKHQIYIQLLYRLYILGNIQKIHHPEPRQQIIPLHLPFPLRQQHLPTLQQSVPRHQVNLNQRILINMPVPTPSRPIPPHRKSQGRR